MDSEIPDTIKFEEGIEVIKRSSESLDSTLKLLNKCSGFGIKTPKEQNFFELAIKVAKAKGQSLKELRDNLEINNKKLKKAQRLFNESAKTPLKFEKMTRGLKLMAEIISQDWDFYSVDYREELRKLALEGKNYIQKINPEEWKYIDKAEYLKSLQMFVNSVLGAVES